jgi:hypothetical protein
MAFGWSYYMSFTHTFPCFFGFSFAIFPVSDVQAFQGNFSIYLTLRALVVINPVIQFFQILMQPVNFLLP